MKRACFLGFALFLALSCASQEIPNRADTANQTPPPTPTPALVADNAPSNSDNEAALEAPPEFKEIDFKNFSYPTNLRGEIRLRDGKSEHKNQEGGGGGTYHFRSIGFADLIGDARKEAVVELIQVSCGASCDGGSSLFYFYSLQKQPSLFWRIETGSLGYGECGLKSFLLAKRTVTLEVFQTCRIRGTKFQPAFGLNQNDENCQVRKYTANTFSRFEFEFRSGKVMRRERKVLPYPPCEIGNYKATVNILGD